MTSMVLSGCEYTLYLRIIPFHTSLLNTDLPKIRRSVVVLYAASYFYCTDIKKRQHDAGAFSEDRKVYNYIIRSQQNSGLVHSDQAAI